jgi:hypothetical protein
MTDHSDLKRKVLARGMHFSTAVNAYAAGTEIVTLLTS